MRALLLVAAFSCSAWGAVTFTITNGDGTTGSNSCSMPYGIAGGYSNGNACTVIVSGTGAWTTHGSDEFFPSVRVCLIVRTLGVITGCDEGAASTGGTLSGTPIELRIHTELDNAPVPHAHCPLSNGVYQCVFTGVTLNGTSITTTAQAAARIAPPVVSTVNKKTATNLVSEGCSYVTPILDYYPADCPMLTPTYPAVGGYDPPAPGGDIIDERFGTHGISLGWNVMPAPIERLLSASGNYALMRAHGDTLDDGIYDTRTATKIYNYPGGVSSIQFLPNADKLAFYGLPEVTLHAYGAAATLVRLRGGPCGSPPCDLIDDGVMWTPPHGETKVQDGGSSALTSDGRALFYGCPVALNCGNDQSVVNWPHVYIVDVYNYQTIIDMDWTDPRVAAGHNGRTPGARGVLMTDRDSQGRYQIQAGATYPSADAFNFYAKDNGDWGALGFNSANAGNSHWQSATDCPANSWDCMTVVHGTMIRSGDTPAWFRSSFEGPSTAGLLSVPGLFDPLATRPAEWAGGGGNVHMPVEHVSASVYPYALVVGSVEPPAGGPWNLQAGITSVSGNPAIATLDGPVSGLTAGNDVYIGCLAHLSGSSQQIQGFYTVPTIQTSPDRITLTGLNWTGTAITSLRCYVTLKTAPASSQARYQIALTRLAQFGNGIRAMQVFPIAKIIATNQIGDGDCGNYYNTQTKPQIAPNGLYVTATMNWGQPCGLMTVRWDVPWQARAQHPNELAPGWPVDFDSNGSGTMLVTAHVPTADTLTCIASTTQDLSTSPTTITFTGPGPTRTQTFTGTPKTAYHWQCRTTHDDFTAVGIAVPL